MFSLTALFPAVTRTWRHQLGFHGCGTPGPGEAALGSLDEHCRLQTGVSQCNDSKQEHCGQGEGRRGDEGEMTWISSEWRIHTRGHYGKGCSESTPRYAHVVAGVAAADTGIFMGTNYGGAMGTELKPGPI